MVLGLFLSNSGFVFQRGGRVPTAAAIWAGSAVGVSSGIFYLLEFFGRKMLFPHGVTNLALSRGPFNQ
jgi:hypothetical protein